MENSTVTPAMIALSSESKRTQKCTPNVLPCKVNHTGPVNASSRLWSTNIDNDEKLTAYFRGRRLRGRRVRLPHSHRGAVLVKAARDTTTQCDIVNSEPMNPEGDEEVGENVAEVFDELASFDELISWGHELLPSEKSDPFVKGLEEWAGFAERMHSFHEADDLAGRNPSKP
ncbi:MAG: 3'-5' exonuclease [Peltula sp. TS41687]|nr:MAG: 3'-5' exonuclease [Peltula sp. TS41687]